MGWCVALSCSVAFDEMTIGDVRQYATLLMGLNFVIELINLLAFCICLNCWADSEDKALGY